MIVGGLANSLAMLIGLTVGLVAGYSGGVVQALLMRIVDVIMSVPLLLLAIALAALLRPVSPSSSWSSPRSTGPAWRVWSVARCSPCAARLRHVRACAGRLRVARDRVAPPAEPGPAGRGVRHPRDRHDDPRRGHAQLSRGRCAAARSTWGNMIFEGQAFFRSAPWLVLIPGVTVMVTVLGFNLLGEGLRDASIRCAARETRERPEAGRVALHAAAGSPGSWSSSLGSRS